MITVSKQRTMPTMTTTVPVSQSILVVDDDRPLAEMVSTFLRHVGYSVEQAHSGQDAADALHRAVPDLVLLDVMLPDTTGWDLCRRIRKYCDVPIIILSARTQTDDRVSGLSLGADDYLSKPFSLREMELRIAAVLRRTRSAVAPTALAPLYEDAHLSVSEAGWRVLCRGQAVALTATERRLLFYLVDSADRTLTTEQLVEQVWPDEESEEERGRYIKLYVWRLRQKLEPDPDRPRYIVTDRGRGYRFVTQSPQKG
ncbi:MAG: response regulator transcription factor [Anaerolineae bacterium]